MNNDNDDPSKILGKMNEDIKEFDEFKTNLDNIINKQINPSLEDIKKYDDKLIDLEENLFDDLNKVMQLKNENPNGGYDQAFSIIQAKWRELLDLKKRWKKYKEDINNHNANGEMIIRTRLTERERIVKNGHVTLDKELTIKTQIEIPLNSKVNNNSEEQIKSQIGRNKEQYTTLETSVNKLILAVTVPQDEKDIIQLSFNNLLSNFHNDIINLSTLMDLNNDQQSLQKDFQDLVAIYNNFILLMGKWNKFINPPPKEEKEDEKDCKDKDGKGGNVVNFPCQEEEHPSFFTRLQCFYNTLKQDLIAINNIYNTVVKTKIDLVKEAIDFVTTKAQSFGLNIDTFTHQMKELYKIYSDGKYGYLLKDAMTLYKYFCVFEENWEKLQQILPK